MPIKPRPLRLTCTSCGWSTVFAPPSDALTSMPPNTCQKCGHEPLTRAPAGTLGTSLLSILDRFKK